MYCLPTGIFQIWRCETAKDLPVHSLSMRFLNVTWYGQSKTESSVVKTKTLSHFLTYLRLKDFFNSNFSWKIRCLSVFFIKTNFKLKNVFYFLQFFKVSLFWWIFFLEIWSSVVQCPKLRHSATPYCKYCTVGGFQVYH